jgi:hypothetical protein
MTRTIDELVSTLEGAGLGWDIGNTGRLIEARVWRWPHVIGRYRPNSMEPVADMLAKAMESAGIKEGETLCTQTK